MALPLVPLLLLIASSLGWAGLDVVRKMLVGKLSSWATMFWLAGGAVPLFLAWALVSGLSAPTAGYWVPALISVSLNVVANLAYLEAVRFAPLSLAAPLLTLTPAFTALTAIPLLGEYPTPRGAAGIVLVIAGAFLLHRAAGPRYRKEGEGSAAPAEIPAEVRRRHRIGALLAALTALLWSLTLPIDKLAIAKAPAPLHGAVLNGGVMLFTLAYLMRRGANGGGLSTIGEGRRASGLLVGAVLISFFSLGTQLLVLPVLFAGILETLKRGIGNLGAVVFGRMVFGEPVTMAKLGAVAVMVSGVALILL